MAEADWTELSIASRILNEEGRVCSTLDVNPNDPPWIDLSQIPDHRVYDLVVVNVCLGSPPRLVIHLDVMFKAHLLQLLEKSNVEQLAQSCRLKTTGKMTNINCQIIFLFQEKRDPSAF